jgi:hypothetical protein
MAAQCAPGIAPNRRSSDSGRIDRRSCLVSPRENAIMASRMMGMQTSYVRRRATLSRSMNRIDIFSGAGALFWEHSLFQLMTILGGVEMPVGGSNQAIASDTPLLKATHAEPVPGPSWPGVGARKNPVILGFIGLEPKVIHYHAKIREGRHKGLRHLGDCAASDGRRALVDTK